MSSNQEQCLSFMCVVAFFYIDICGFLSGLSPVGVATGVNLSLYSHQYCICLPWDQCDGAQTSASEGSVPALIQPCRGRARGCCILSGSMLPPRRWQRCPQSLGTGRGDSSTQSLTVSPSSACMPAWYYPEELLG